MHRWDEGSFPFRYQEAFCSNQPSQQESLKTKKMGWRRKVFRNWQLIIKD